MACEQLKAKSEQLILIDNGKLKMHVGQTLNNGVILLLKTLQANG